MDWGSDKPTTAAAAMDVMVFVDNHIFDDTTIECLPCTNLVNSKVEQQRIAIEELESELRETVAPSRSDTTECRISRIESSTTNTDTRKEDDNLKENDESLPKSYTSTQVVHHVDERAKTIVRKAELDELKRMNLIKPQAARLQNAPAPVELADFYLTQRALNELQRENQRNAKDFLHKYRADKELVLQQTSRNSLRSTISREDGLSCTAPDATASSAPAYATKAEIDKFLREQRKLQSSWQLEQTGSQVKKTSSGDSTNSKSSSDLEPTSSLQLLTTYRIQGSSLKDTGSGESENLKTSFISAVSSSVDEKQLDAELGASLSEIQEVVEERLQEAIHVPLPSSPRTNHNSLKAQEIKVFNPSLPTSPNGKSVASIDSSQFSYRVKSILDIQSQSGESKTSRSESQGDEASNSVASTNSGMSLDSGILASRSYYVEGECKSSLGSPSKRSLGSPSKRSIASPSSVDKEFCSESTEVSLSCGIFATGIGNEKGCVSLPMEYTTSGVTKQFYVCEGIREDPLESMASTNTDVSSNLEMPAIHLEASDDSKNGECTKITTLSRSFEESPGDNIQKKSEIDSGPPSKSTEKEANGCVASTDELRSAPSTDSVNIRVKSSSETITSFSALPTFLVQDPASKDNECSPKRELDERSGEMAPAVPTSNTNRSNNAGSEATLEGEKLVSEAESGENVDVPVSGFVSSSSMPSDEGSVELRISSQKSNSSTVDATGTETVEKIIDSLETTSTDASSSSKKTRICVEESEAKTSAFAFADPANIHNNSSPEALSSQMTPSATAASVNEEEDVKNAKGDESKTIEEVTTSFFESMSSSQSDQTSMEEMTPNGSEMMSAESQNSTAETTDTCVSTPSRKVATCSVSSSEEERNDGNKLIAETNAENNSEKVGIISSHGVPTVAIDKSISESSSCVKLETNANTSVWGSKIVPADSKDSTAETTDTFISEEGRKVATCSVSSSKEISTLIPETNTENDTEKVDIIPSPAVPPVATDTSVSESSSCVRSETKTNSSVSSLELTTSIVSYAGSIEATISNHTTSDTLSKMDTEASTSSEQIDSGSSTASIDLCNKPTTESVQSEKSLPRISETDDGLVDPDRNVTLSCNVLESNISMTSYAGSIEASLSYHTTNDSLSKTDTEASTSSRHADSTQSTSSVDLSEKPAAESVQSKKSLPLISERSSDLLDPENKNVILSRSVQESTISMTSYAVNEDSFVSSEKETSNVEPSEERHNGNWLELEIDSTQSTTSVDPSKNPTTESVQSEKSLPLISENDSGMADPDGNVTLSSSVQESTISITSFITNSITTHDESQNKSTETVKEIDCFASSGKEASNLESSQEKPSGNWLELEIHSSPSSEFKSAGANIPVPTNDQSDSVSSIISAPTVSVDGIEMEQEKNIAVSLEKGQRSNVLCLEVGSSSLEEAVSVLVDAPRPCIDTSSIIAVSLNGAEVVRTEQDSEAKENADMSLRGSESEMSKASEVESVENRGNLQEVDTSRTSGDVINNMETIDKNPPPSNKEALSHAERPDEGKICTGGSSLIVEPSLSRSQDRTIADNSVAPEINALPCAESKTIDVTSSSTLPSNVSSPISGQTVSVDCEEVESAEVLTVELGSSGSKEEVNILVDFSRQFGPSRNATSIITESSTGMEVAKIEQEVEVSNNTMSASGPESDTAKPSTVGTSDDLSELQIAKTPSTSRDVIEKLEGNNEEVFKTYQEAASDVQHPDGLKTCGDGSPLIAESLFSKESGNVCIDMSSSDYTSETSPDVTGKSADEAYSASAESVPNHSEKLRCHDESCLITEPSRSKETKNVCVEKSASENSEKTEIKLHSSNSSGTIDSCLSSSKESLKIDSTRSKEPLRIDTNPSPSIVSGKSRRSSPFATKHTSGSEKPESTPKSISNKLNTPRKFQSKIPTPKVRTPVSGLTTVSQDKNMIKIRYLRPNPYSPSTLERSITTPKGFTTPKGRKSPKGNITPKGNTTPKGGAVLKRVPLYVRRPLKPAKKDKGPICTLKYVPSLHKSLDGCERCLYWASSEEKKKFLAEGYHLRIMKIRGGCDRSCCVFPRKDDEYPVRLCRKCYYDTHQELKEPSVEWERQAALPTRKAIA